LIAILAALILTPAAQAAGSFSSSDGLLNLVWQKSVQTATDMLAPGPLSVDWLGRACAIDVATVILDGTVRDRCPYIGDEPPSRPPPSSPADTTASATGCCSSDRSNTDQVPRPTTGTSQPLRPKIVDRMARAYARTRTSPCSEVLGR